MSRLDELKTLKDTDQRSTLVLAGTSLLTCLMIGGMVKAPLDWKPVAALTGLGASIFGLIAGKNGEKARYRLEDWQDVEDSSFATNLAYEMSPKMFGVEERSSSVNVDPFNWDELRKRRDEYPHLLLLGKTGAGKSVLAERLCSMLGGKVLAVAPHYKRGDYASANVIVGQGRNVGQSILPYSDEPERGKSQDLEHELDFDDIAEGRVKATAAQFMNALLREMNRRYQLVDPDTGMPDDNGVYTSDYEQAVIYNIILDETPVLAKLPGWNDVFPKLVREARKVGLRLVVLTQGKEVKSLGIEGEGSIRESLTFIWLYPFVEDEAARILASKKLDEDKAYWQQVIKLLKANKYSALVEDQFALTPVEPQWLAMRDELAAKKFAKAKEMTAINGNGYQAEKPSAQVLESGAYHHASSPNIVINNNSNSNAVATSSVSASDSERKLRKQLWSIANAASRQGANRSDIVKNALGYKSERYQEGRLLLTSLEAEFGKLEGS